MPETLTTSEEQRNNFAFDKEKGEICLENFKMSRKSLYKLCWKFKSYFVKKDKTDRIQISVQSQIHNFLYDISDELRNWKTLKPSWYIKSFSDKYNK